MAEANWFWAEGEQRNGPVAGSLIARMVADGKLVAEDLIWKEGMADWIEVGKVPALVKYLKTPAGSAATVLTSSATQPAAVQTPTSAPGIAAPVDLNDRAAAGTTSIGVGYYNPSTGLPPRAALTLKKHAAPRGDVSDWPLDDSRVAQFDEALNLRKSIDRAASLFRLVLFIIAIVDVGMVIGGVVAVMASRRPMSGPVIGSFVFIGGMLERFPPASSARPKILIFSADGILHGPS